jgi:hypothetical protein
MLIFGSITGLLLAIMSFFWSQYITSWSVKPTETFFVLVGIGTLISILVQITSLSLLEYWRRSAVLWGAVLRAFDEAQGNDLGQKELVRRIGKSATKRLLGEAVDSLAKS